jgi:hypothetical protein
MTLKVTMTINQDYSEDLIGLLTKAFGRGELGIGDIKIERADPLDVGLKAIHQATVRPIRKSTVAKMIGKSKRGSPGLGNRAFRTGKINGAIITLTGLSHGGSRDGLRAMLEAHDINPNGLSPLLSKMVKQGYVVMHGAGVYDLTPKGMEVVKRWNERDDNANRE